jgi:hypothetical protein
MIPTMAEVQAGYYDDHFDTVLPEPWDPAEDDRLLMIEEARWEMAWDD